MKVHATLILCLSAGCIDSLEDLEGTNCRGAIPTRITIVDAEMEHVLPCSASEAVDYERASNADSFRKNDAGVLCLLEEAKIECVVVEGDEQTLFRCETSHPLFEGEAHFPLVSVVAKGSHCP